MLAGEAAMDRAMAKGMGRRIARREALLKGALNESYSDGIKDRFMEVPAQGIVAHRSCGIAVYYNTGRFLCQALFRACFEANRQVILIL